MEQCGLAAATRHTVRFSGVLAIFDDVEVERAHLNGAEAHQALHHFMEIVRFVCLQDVILCRLGTTDCPAIQHHHLFRFHHVFYWIETVEVRQQEARGVTDTTIAVGSTFQDLIGNRHFAGVVSRCHPQTQNIGAQFVHHVLRRDSVTDGFGHLAALTIDGEAVGQHLAIRRFALHGGGDHQR
ncbi:hypothetical protein D3C75_594910 [compost metagenome]